MTDIDQAAALELMAGKRQANTLAAIIENFDTAVAARDAALNSSGSAWQENEAYLDSINGKIGQFQAAFQGLSTSILDSDLAKWFIDLGTAITQAMQAITETAAGPGWLLGGALGAFASYQDAGILSVINDPDTFSGKRIQSILGQSKGISDTEIVQIQEYNKLVDELAIHVDGAKDRMDKFNSSVENTRLGDFVSGLNGARTDVDAFSKSLNGASIASKAASVGLNLLAGVGNMIAGAVAGIAINALINGIVYLATAEERAAQAAKEATEAYQEQSSSLQGYRTRVEELNAQLSSGTLSYEESKAARQELLQIQDEMISKFGSEADSANLVTAAINGQADAWERLGKQEYDQWVGEVSEDGVLDKARKSFENPTELFLPTNDYSDFKEFEDSANDMMTLATDVNRELSRMFPDTIKTDDGINYYLDILPEELNDSNGVLQDIIHERTRIISELGEAHGFSAMEIDALNDSFSEGLTLDKQTLQAELSEQQTIYKEYLDGYVRYYSDFADNYSELTSAHRLYEEAVAGGDASVVQERLAEFRSAYQEVISEIESSNLDSGLKSNVIDYFENLFPDLASEISKWNFGDVLESTLRNSARVLKGIDENELLDYILLDGETTVKSAYEKIAKAAADIGVIAPGTEFEAASIQTIVDLLIELGYVSGDTSAQLDVIATSFGNMRESMLAAQEEAATVTEILNSQGTGVGVTLENFEALIAMNEDYADALEYNNGVMQINAERAREIADADITAQVAKATTEMKLQGQQLRTTEEALTDYKNELRNLYAQQARGVDVNEEQIALLERTISSYEEQSSAIQSNIEKYAVLISSLRETTGAYQLWKDAQNAPESGDMYDDTLTALQQIEEGFETGKVGTQKFEASVEFLVPDDVDRENADAIEEYKNNVLDRYITFDEENNKLVANGVNNFLNDAVAQGLATIDENNDWSVKAGVLMQDFVDKLHLTPEMVRAIFGELEEYGFDFTWDDEFVESMELTEEEIKTYRDQINQTISEIGNDPVEIKANLNELTQAYADLYDMENYGIPGTIELPINVKANLQIQEEIEEKQGEIDKLTEDLFNEDGTVNLEVQTNIASAERELTELQLKLSLLDQPTEVEVELATSIIDEQIAALQERLNSLTVGTPEYTEVQGQIDTLNQTKVTITSLLDTDDFDSSADNVEGKADELDKKEIKPEIKLNGYTIVMRQLNNVAAKIAGLPTRKEITIAYNTTASGSGGGSGNRGATSTKPFALGTATTGYAYANGNWGISHAQRALVGELGRELVVDPYTGKWKTVGDFGAEIVSLPKGAIVFNHKQTEEILEKGYVHGRGTALVTGNAFVGGGGSMLPIEVGMGNSDWNGNKVINSNNKLNDSLKDTAKDAKDAADAVEEYVSELWKLYEVETKLSDIEVEVEFLETQLDMAESANEAIGIQEQLIDAYERQQDALHNLADARRELIQQDISKLRDQGFEIEYDPTYNKLFIKNMEHINDLVGTVSGSFETAEERENALQEATNELRQETEEMIESVIDMNEANQDAGASWWEMEQAIQDVKNEIADNSISIFDDFIEYMDSFELWGDSAEDRVDVLKKKQAELNRLWELGYLTLDKYKELTLDNQTEIYESQRDAITEIIELTEEMIKQEVEDQIEALEKQIDAYREIIDLRKEALDQGKNERDHQNDVNDKLAEMLKLRQRIDRLALAEASGDRAAAAEKAKLEEELAELQRALADSQADYSYDQAKDALDKQQEAYEEQKNNEIEILEDSIDTQVKLYNAAIARINEGWDKLYDDLLDYTITYKDAINGPDSLKTAWEIATDAVKDYAYNVEAALEGIKNAGSIGNIMSDDANSIINQMRLNGRKWNAAKTPEEKAQYEAANERLAQQLSAIIGRPVVKDYEGFWHLDSATGEKLYDVYPGTLDADKVNSLIDQMQANGSQWAGASSADKKKIERANEQLAAQIEQLIGREVIKGYDGEWYLDEVGGKRLYDVWKGTSSMPSAPSKDEADQSNKTDVQVRALVRDMRSNGTKYANAVDDDERAYYAAQNRQIAAQIEKLLGRKVVIGDDGVWYLDRVGGVRLYDIYHKGGIVGGEGTLKDNEVFSVLEKGEFVLSDSQKKNLFDLVEMASKLNSTPKDRLVSTPSSVSANSFGDTFQADFQIAFNMQDSLDESSIKKYGDMFANYAIRKLQSGFSKSGVSPIKTASGKR